MQLRGTEVDVMSWKLESDMPAAAAVRDDRSTSSNHRSARLLAMVWGHWPGLMAVSMVCDSRWRARRRAKAIDCIPKSRGRRGVSSRCRRRWRRRRGRGERKTSTQKKIDRDIGPTPGLCASCLACEVADRCWAGPHSATMRTLKHGIVS